jgi:hypothetical protein
MPGWETAGRLAAASSPAPKVEILKHLDGDLVIVPRPWSPGERRAEISGRAKADRLLRDQERFAYWVCKGRT